MPFNLLKALRNVKKEKCKAFQFLSDLHLELGNQYQSLDIPPVAPYLILAGDIGRLIDYEQYLAFLQRQTAQFELVFIVLGNHEFYGTNFPHGLLLARCLASEPILEGKLILLNRTRYDIPGTPVTLLGCTLWSHVPSESVNVVQAKISDFRRIDGWDVRQQNAAHVEDAAWLKSEVTMLNTGANTSSVSEGMTATETPKTKIIVVTHHAPLKHGTSSPRNENNAWSSAFASDVLAVQEKKQNWEGVNTWIFGHTHFSTDFLDHETGVRVVANQRGYVLPGAALAQRLDSKDVKEAEFNLRKVIRV